MKSSFIFTEDRSIFVNLLYAVCAWSLIVALSMVIADHSKALGDSIVLFVLALAPVAGAAVMNTFYFAIKLLGAIITTVTKLLKKADSTDVL